MWDKILEVVAQYGPFPVGIVFGVMIKRWSDSELMKTLRAEIQTLRDEKSQLLDQIQAKELRIDALHDKLNTQ